MSEGNTHDRGAPLPAPRRRVACRVERSYRGKHGLDFVLLNVAYRGEWCHYDETLKRTYRHIEGADCCPVCVLTHRQPRWYGFVGGWDLFNKWQAVVVLTEGAVQNNEVLRVESAADNLLGLRLWVGRMNDSKRGPVRCTLGGLHDGITRDQIKVFPLKARVDELFDAIPPAMLDAYDKEMRS